MIRPDIKNKKTRKIFDYLGVIGLIALFGGTGISYLTENTIYLLLGTTFLLFVIGSYTIFILRDSLKEKSIKDLRGFHKKWYQANRIFGTIGSIALILLFFGLPIAWLTGYYQIILIFIFLFLGYLLSLPVIIGYFAIRKREVMKEDFESAKYMIVPVTMILLLSALARSQIGLNGIITVFVITVIVIGLTHLWRRKIKK